MNSRTTQAVDYYARLGVPADASLNEIKNAYRDLVKRYHPDVYPFDNHAARQKAELAMRQINEAYAVLSNSEKRCKYDEYFQEYIVAQIELLKGDVTMNSDPKFNTKSFSEWPDIMHQFLSDRQETARRRPIMGVFRKALLVPIPFCMATAVCSTFWNLGQLTGALFLGRLTAILSYPLILVLMFLRLIPPIRHAPLLNIKQKIICLPIIMLLATLVGWIWFTVVDQFGTVSNPWDLCWWCGLIGITCVVLAYL